MATKATLAYWKYRLEQHRKNFTTFGLTKEWQQDHRCILRNLKVTKKKLAP